MLRKSDAAKLRVTLGRGQGGNTGRVAICGKENACGENHPKSRTPAVAALSRKMKREKKPTIYSPTNQERT